MLNLKILQKIIWRLGNKHFRHIELRTFVSIARNFTLVANFLFVFFPSLANATTTTVHADISARMPHKQCFHATPGSIVLIIGCNLTTLSLGIKLIRLFDKKNRLIAGC